MLSVEPSAPTVDTAAHDADTGAVSLFAVNRHLAEPLELTADLRALGDLTVIGAEHIAETDPYLTNDVANPDRIRLRPLGVTNPTAAG